MTRKTREFKSEIETTELLTLNLDDLAECMQRVIAAYADGEQRARVYMDVLQHAHRRRVDPARGSAHVWYTMDGRLA